MPWLTNPYRFGSPFGVAYATLTIASGKVTADVSGHPVRVNLADMPSGFWSAVQSDGRDIRVTRLSDGQAVPVDVVSISKAGSTGEIFFRANLLAASNNVFQVRAGGFGLTMPAVTDPLGRNAVWSGYHMAYAFSGGSAVDRTGNGRDLAEYGSGTVSGFSGGGLVLGSQRVFSASLGASHPAAYTVGAIAQNGFTGPNANNLITIDDVASGAISNPFVSLQWVQYRNRWTIRHTGFTFVDDSNTVADLAGDYEFFGYAWNGSTATLYTRGVSSGSGSVPSVTGTEIWYQLGQGGADTWDGTIFMAYMRAEVSSAARIKAEADSWRSPSTFYAVT